MIAFEGASHRSRALGARLLAVERAVDQGCKILRQGRSHVGALIAKGDRDFATAFDVQVEETIKTALHELTPDVPFLGEEHLGAALGTGPTWVLDPIDGTVNFSRGSPLCGISLALLQDGRPRLAVVDLPFLCERYIAIEGSGAFLNGRQIHCAPVTSLREAVVGLSDFSVGHDAPTENPLHLALVARLARTVLRSMARKPSTWHGRRAGGSERRSCSRTFRGTSAAVCCSYAKPAVSPSTSTGPSTRPPPAAPSRAPGDCCSRCWI